MEDREVFELPDDQKVYLLKTRSGLVMQKIAGKDSIAGFVLAFTTVGRARAFAKKFRRPKITGILEVPLKDYLDRPDQPPLALDVNPGLFDYA